MKLIKNTFAVILSAILLLQGLTPVLAEETVLKSWTFSSSVPDDITAGIKVTAAVSDGILTMTASNKPNALFNLGTSEKPLNLMGSDLRRLKLRMKIEGEKMLSVSPVLISYSAEGVAGTKSAEWTTDDNGAEIIYNGDFADYEFDLTRLPDLTEDTTVTQIIIQPMRLSRTATASFEKIEITGVKTVLPPTVELVNKTEAETYETGDVLTFDATVKNAESLKKLELIVNGDPVQSTADNQYLFSYELKAPGDYTFYAKATLSDDTVISSAETVITCTEHVEQIFRQWSFNEGSVPADIGKSSGIALASENGALKVTVSKSFQSVNISPYSPLGFSTKDYKYLKLKVKNTMKATKTTDPVAFTIYYSDGSSDTIFCAKDSFENEIKYDDKFYRQYIFDLTRDVSNTDKTITWIEAYLFRRAESGVAYIDDITISDTPSFDEAVPEASVFYPENGDEFSLGQTIAVTSGVSTDGCEKIEYYVNNEYAGTGSGGDYSLDYTFTKIGTHTIKAVAYFASSTIESQAVTINVTVSNAAEGTAWEFDSGVGGWYTNGSLAGLSAEGGALVMEIKGESAPLRIDNQSINGSSCKYLRIRMKNETGNNNLVFQWAETTFSNSNLFEATADSSGKKISVNDTEFREYVFDLSQYSGWTDTVKTLQLFPAKNAKSGRILFDSIEIYGLMPTLDAAVSGGTVYPSPVTITPSVKAANTKIVKTELYINGEKVKEYPGLSCAPYTYIPLTGGKTQVFVASHDENGEISFSKTKEFSYTAPFDFGSWECKINDSVASVRVPMMRNLDDFASPVIFAASYSNNGRMLSSKAVQTNVTDFGGAAEFDLSFPDNADYITVYAWDSLVGAVSYHKPMVYKIK